GCGHIPTGRSKGSGGWVEYLGSRGRGTAVIDSPRHKHFAVLEQRCCMRLSRRSHATGRGETMWEDLNGEILRSRILSVLVLCDEGDGNRASCFRFSRERSIRAERQARREGTGFTPDEWHSS